MRKLALILVGACAMAAVLVAVSSGASSNAGPRDAVWGGGHLQFGFGGLTFDRDFSVNIELGRFGNAEGSFIYGNNGTSGGPRPISCLAVSGDHAVIGGADPSGNSYLWYAVDNGTPVSAVRDQVTPLLLLEPADLAQMPPGFPNVCPSPDAVINGSPYSELTGGDIVIRDVT
jgi:hypothetical protein